LRKAIKIGLGIAVGVGAFFLLAVIVYLYDISELRSLSIEELESISVDWEYDDILRNPEKYEYKLIHFEGQIIYGRQHFFGDYGLQVRIDCKPIPNNFDCNDFWVDYTGKRLLVDDVVEVYAQVDWIEDIELTDIGVFVPMPRVTAIRVNCLNC